MPGTVHATACNIVLILSVTRGVDREGNGGRARLSRLSEYISNVYMRKAGVGRVATGALPIWAELAVGL